jgi:hypothetical protein
MPITSEPPPHTPPAGVAHARIKGTYGDTAWATGFWLLVGGTPLFADITALATDMFGIFETTLLTQLDNDVVETECDVEYWTGTGNMISEVFGAHNGGVVGGGFGASTAAVISWAITDSYRGGKPRNYLPGVPIGAAGTQRLFTDAFVSSLRTQAAAFLADVNAITTTHISSVALGVVHFFRGGVALSPPTFDPYIGASVQKRYCSQRRRLGAEI